MTDFDGDEVVVVGRPLPRIAAVTPLDGLHVAVTWQAGGRAKDREVVDLGPAVARFKLYAPLQDDPALFATVRVQEHGYGVAWGDGSIDMASTTIADAADETMAAEDFAAFMARHGFTLDRVAAELGISRRMAAYYKKQARVPRTVALACRYLDAAVPARGRVASGLVDPGAAQEPAYGVAGADSHASTIEAPDLAWFENVGSGLVRTVSAGTADPYARK